MAVTTRATGLASPPITASSPFKPPPAKEKAEESPPIFDPIPAIAPPTVETTPDTPPSLPTKPTTAPTAWATAGATAPNPRAREPTAAAIPGSAAATPSNSPLERASLNSPTFSLIPSNAALAASTGPCSWGNLCTADETNPSTNWRAWFIALAATSPKLSKGVSPIFHSAANPFSAVPASEIAPRTLETTAGALSMAPASNFTPPAAAPIAPSNAGMREDTNGSIRSAIPAIASVSSP